MNSDSLLLKRFLLAVLLWLPLAFLAWSLFADWLAYVPGRLVEWSLTGFWPQLFSGMEQHGSNYQVATGLMVADPGGRMGQLVFDLNSMMYGYSLPLLAGLIMATPLSPARRALQMLLALPWLWLAQALGLASSALRLLAFDSGSQGVAAAAANGLSAEWIALWYQFTYLILPAVLPVLLWILMNRQFIDGLGRVHKEPTPV